MTRPSVLLLDEPSLGLAPILVQQIFKIIREINARGMTILLVEQNALQALSIANRGYVLQTGECVLSGDGAGPDGQRDGPQGLPRRGLTRGPPPALPTMTAAGPTGARIGPPDDTPVLPDRRARVARRGAGPSLVAVLVIAAAFVVGMVRPWDWLGRPPPASRDTSPAWSGLVRPAPRRAASGRRDRCGRLPRAAVRGRGCRERRLPRPRRSARRRAPSPLGWRAATIESWTGRRRPRVWAAAEAVPATGPEDPPIPFRPIVSETVTAIGWCAPVEGAERPPLTATGTAVPSRDERPRRRDRLRTPGARGAGRPGRAAGPAAAVRGQAAAVATGALRDPAGDAVRRVRPVPGARGHDAWPLATASRRPPVLTAAGSTSSGG